MKPEKQLYQWDTNQSFVELTPSAQFVDYPIGDEVIRIKADGTRCRIPDEVLQTTAEKPAMNVTRTEPTGRIVSRCCMRQSRRTMYSHQKNGRHSKP